MLVVFVTYQAGFEWSDDEACTVSTARMSLSVLCRCHSTHGLSTPLLTHQPGFIIISAAMRILAERGWCVERLFRRFAAQVGRWRAGGGVADLTSNNSSVQRPGP